MRWGIPGCHRETGAKICRCRGAGPYAEHAWRACGGAVVRVAARSDPVPMNPHRSAAGNVHTQELSPAARRRGDDVRFAFDGLVLPEEVILDPIGLAARRFIAGSERQQVARKAFLRENGLRGEGGGNGVEGRNRWSHDDFWSDEGSSLADRRPGICAREHARDRRSVTGDAAPRSLRTGARRRRSRSRIRLSP